jgi:membrane peptidoglycan carboxypeptidase
VRGAWLRRRTLKIAAFVTLALVAVGGFVGFGLAAGLGSLPNADALVSAPLASDTLVYDRTGQVLLADLHPEGYQHYESTLSGMGKWLPMATVAVEDSNFWHEPGVDPFSMARAALTDFQHHSLVQGGSTITQQLVKERLVGNDASFTRKFREAALAMRISSDFSKTQILGMYLNAIAYGNAAYGAQAAARIYFHTDASKLDLAQASLVAGLPQNPTLLNPLQHWQAAKGRQHEVLAAMVRTGDITQEEADQAYAEDLSAPAHLFPPGKTDLTPGFTMWLVGELSARFGQSAVEQGGMRVISTVDWNLQQLAQNSITNTVKSQGWRHLTDGALVSIDPRTGQVLAMVGSAGDVPGGQYNMAAWPPRNPGSSFKVFTYTAAIDSRRYTMVTPIVDAPLTVQMPGASPYKPENYDHRYHGTCQVQVCLGNSLNIPAVEVEMGTGVAAVADEARKVGAPPFQSQGSTYSNTVPSSTFTPSLTLGGYGETPLQMATGVATLAAGGVEHPAEGILKVTSSSGQVLLHPASAGQQVVDAGTAYIVSQMLSDAGNRAMIFGRNTPLTLSGHRAAAKTGTTDKFNDAWTIGYTPSLATAVWMGNTDNSPMSDGSDGIYVAAPAWHDFMQAALDRMNKGDEWFQQPADVTMDFFRGSSAWFLSGTSAATPPPPLPSTVHVAGSGDCGGDTCPGGGGGRRCRPIAGFPFIQPCLPVQTLPPQVVPPGG